MKRRIKKAQITHVSLVPKGRNLMPVLFKEDSNTAEFAALVKAGPNFDERGELLTVVYAAEKRDKEGDIASVQVVKEMAYSHARSGFQLDIRHDSKVLTKDQAYVAESFVIQKGDPRFQDWKDTEGNPVDTTGAWGQVIQIDDPALRKGYRDGTWNGVSLAGPAEVEIEKSQIDEFLALLAKGLRPDTPASTDVLKDMDKAELAALLKESNTGLVTELGKLLKPETPKPPDKEEEKPPLFKGDFTNPRDVETHAQALRSFQLRKSIDWSDEKAVSNYLATLSKKDEGNEKKDDKPEETQETKDLRKQLDETQKQLEKSLSRSKQSTKDSKDKEPENESLSKEDQDLIAVGKEMGKLVNESRGVK